MSNQCDILAQELSDYLGALIAEPDSLNDVHDALQWYIDNYGKNDSVKTEIISFIDKLNEIESYKQQDAAGYLKRKLGYAEDDLTKYFGEISYDEQSKNEEDYDKQERQEQLSSYHSQYFANYKEYMDFLNFSTSQLKTIILFKKFNSNNKQVRTIRDLNENIIYTQAKLLSQLYDNYLFMHRNDTGAKQNRDEINSIIAKIDGRNKSDVEEAKNECGIPINWITTISKCVEDMSDKLLNDQNKVRFGHDGDPQENKRAIILLKTFDSELKRIFKKSIYIPGGFFNVYAQNKVYGFSDGNELAQSWRSNEEDVNDMEELATIIASVIESIPSYTSTGNGQWIKSPNRFLEFNEFTEAVNLLNKLVYDIEVEDDVKQLKELFIQDTIWDNKQEKNVEPEHPVLNFFGDKLRREIYEKYGKNRTFKDFLGQLHHDRTLLMPIALLYLFKPSARRDAWTDLQGKLRKINLQAFNALYSAYDAIWNIENKDSFVYQDAVHDQTNSTQSITDIINQAVNSITFQQFVSYEYSQEDKRVVSKQLKSKAMSYEEFSLSRQINGMNLAFSTPIDIEKTINQDGNSTDAFSNFLKNGNTSIQIYFKEDKLLENTILKLEKDKNGNIDLILETKVDGDNGTKTVITKWDGKNYTIDGDENIALDSTNFNSIILPIINTFLPIQTNNIFHNLMESNDRYKISTTAVALGTLSKIITNGLANNIISGDKPEIFKISNEDRESFSRFTNKTSAENEYKKYATRNENVRTRKYEFQLDLTDSKTYYDSFQPVAEMNLQVKGVVLSGMVVDNDRKQLNSQKLSQASNIVHNLWTDQKGDINNPNSELALYDCYQGCEIIRDYKDRNGNVVKATDLNPSEHLSANFLVEFLDSINSGKISLPGPVVSDKPFIIRLAVNLQKALQYEIGETGSLQKFKNGEKITLQQILEDKNSHALLHKLVNYELGRYYKKQYRFVTDQYDKISKIIENKEVALKYLLRGFGVTSSEITDIFEICKQNKIDFNDVCFYDKRHPVTVFDDLYSLNNAFDIGKLNNFITKISENTNEKLSRKLLKIASSIKQGTVIKNFIRGISLSDNSFEFIDNLCGWFDKKGNIHANPLLIDNLFQYYYYEENTEDDEGNVVLGYNPGYDILKALSADVNQSDPRSRARGDFFKQYWGGTVLNQEAESLKLYSEQKQNECDDMFVSDMIRQDYKMQSFQYTTSDKDDEIHRIISKDNEYLQPFGKKYIINSAKISYGGEVHYLSDQASLKFFKPFQQMQNVLNFLDKYETDIDYGIDDVGELHSFLELLKEENLRISSPQFSITKVVNILNSKSYQRALNAYLEFKEIRDKLNIEEEFDLLDKNVQDACIAEIERRYSELDEKNKNIEQIKLRIANTEKQKVILKHKAEEQLKFYRVADIAFEEEQVYKLEFNKLFTDYNALSNLFNEEHKNATVGTYLNHPIKPGKSLVQLRQDCIGAQVKRNVTYSATKHQYILNNLYGIPDNINIAVVDNPSDEVYNLVADDIDENGNGPTQLADDGATYVYSPMSILENNSLKSNKVGQDKKQFGGAVNARSGSGFILKTAGFELTCDRIRRSKYLQNLNRKMGSKPFLTGDQTFKGESFVDITHDFKGNKIDFGKLGIYYAIPKLNTETGELVTKYYHLSSFELADNGNYTKIVQEVDRHGKPINSQEFTTEINPRTINNLHSVWELLGGMFSCQFTNIDGEEVLSYVNCNRSFENLVYLMNNVGELTEGAKLYTQTTVNQIMKKSMIAYAPTDGAVKQGCTNRNGIEAFTDDDYELSTFNIPTTDLGVQLDAEHSVEETAVALMTQVMNAAAARGYSVEQGDEIYEALHEITMLSVGDIFNSINSTDQNILNISKEKVADVILSALKKSQSADSDLLQAIQNDIKEEMLSNKNTLEILTENIPIDDPSILRKILNNFVTSLQRSSVKLKFSGNQLVLVPSNGYFKFYDGKLLDEWGGNEEDVITYLTKKQESIRLNGKETNKKITRNNIRDLQNEFKNGADKVKITKIDKDGSRTSITVTSANLTALETEIISSSRTGKSEYYINEVSAQWITDPADVEMDVSYEYVVNDDEDDNNGKIKTIRITNPTKLWEFQKKIESGKVKDVLRYLPDPTDLACATYTFEGAYNIDNGENQELKTKKFSIWDLASVRRKWEIEQKIKQKKKAGEDTSSDEMYAKELIDAIQNDLLILGDVNNGNEINVIINGQPELVTIDRKTIKQTAFPAILPQVFKTKFGLSAEDKISDIVNNKYFFLKKQAKRAKDIYESNSTPNEQTVTLVGPEYSLNLLYFNPKDKSSQTVELNGYQELKHSTIKKGKKTYRINPRTGELMYEMQDGDKIYSNGIKEIIVTKNINFYLDQKKYNQIVFFEIEEKKGKEEKKLQREMFNKFINQCARSKNRSISKFVKHLKNNNEDWLTGYNKLIEDYKKDLDNIADDEYKTTSYMIKSLENSALALHGSFMSSLNTIASRTPAQCQQSFMSQTCVAFDTSGKNSMHVSRWQLWLQGSDFDIDKANIITYDIKNGLMRKHSSLQNFAADEDVVKIADKVSLGTGLEIGDSNENGENLENIIKETLKHYVNPGQSVDDLYAQFIAMMPKSPKMPETTSSSFEEFKDLMEYAKNIEDLNNETKHELFNLTKNKEFMTLLVPIVNEIAKYQKRGINSFKYDDELYTLILIINDHNTYLQQQSEDYRLSALKNFISKRIWQISSNPMNWMQGWKSVDVVTGPWKDSANIQPLAKAQQRMIGESVFGLFSQLQLTLQGKDNVGIVASSLKVFEALSHEIYDVLNSGDIEQIKNLFFTLQINGEIIHSISNAWCNDKKFKQLPEEIQKILNALNHDGQDAFLELSALLSLAADNAKDPTMAKINADQNMVGLYTVGLMVGIDRDSLIKTINSETGVLVSKLLSGDRIQGIEGFKNFREIARYVKSNPAVGNPDFTKFKRFLGITADDEKNAKAGTLILKSPQKIFGSLYGDDYKVLSSLGKKILSSLNKALKEGVITQIVREELSEYEQSYIDNHDDYRDFIKLFNRCLKNIAKYKNFDNIDPDETDGNDTNTNSEEENDNNNQEQSVDREQQIKSVKRLINDLYQYYSVVDVIQNDTYDAVSLHSRKEYKRRRWDDLKKLISINEEGQKVRQIVTLNQGYANSIEEQIQFVANFQNILVDLYKYLPSGQRNQENENQDEDSDTDPESKIDPDNKDHVDIYRPPFKSEKLNKDNPEIVATLELLTECNKTLGIDKYKYTSATGNVPFISFDYFMDPNANIAISYNDAISILEKGMPQTNKENASEENAKTYFEYLEKLHVIEKSKEDENVYLINYRNLAIQMGHVLSMCFNPLKVADTVQHYSGYLKGMYSVYAGGKQISGIYRASVDYIQKVFDDMQVYTAQDKQDVVKKFMNYLHRIKNIYFFQWLNEFKWTCPGDFVGATGDIEMTLKTENERNAFKRFVEEVVLQKLKKELPNNIFIQSLHIEQSSTTPTHNVQSVILTEINTIPKTKNEVDLYRAAKQDLYDVRDYKVGGMKLKDVLYLYNLIATDNLYQQNGIQPLFEDIVTSEMKKDINKSLITKYMEFEKIFAQEHVYFGQDSIEDIDSAERYCAPVVSWYSKKNKYKYVFTQNPNTKRVNLYGLDQNNYYSEDQERAFEEANDGTVGTIDYFTGRNPKYSQKALSGTRGMMSDTHVDQFVHVAKVDASKLRRFEHQFKIIVNNVEQTYQVYQKQTGQKTRFALIRVDGDEKFIVLKTKDGIIEEKCENDGYMMKNAFAKNKTGQLTEIMTHMFDDNRYVDGGYNIEKIQMEINNLINQECK